MNKKVMAVAVAGVLAAPAALAQSSNVQIYGRANIGFDWYQAKGSSVAGADRDSRNRVFDNSSRVGFRGSEDLGNGLKAIFQIETGVQFDSGDNLLAQGGQTNASTGLWGSRATFAGLDSNWGRLTFGRQNIYWVNGPNAQFAANYINTEIPWTNGLGLGRLGGANQPGQARVDNTVQYTTPTFSGINGTLSYSVGQGVVNQESVQNIGASIDPDGRIFGATLRGTFGAFYAQIDYVDVQANTSSVGPGTLRNDGDSWKVGASWGYMPGARVGLIYVQSKVNNATGWVAGLAAGDNVKQDGWTLNWEQTFGNVQVMAQYGQTGDMKDCNEATATISCNNSSSKGFMVGARYLLSKRTWVYASWNQVDNKENQFSDYGGGGITSTVGAPTPYGADPQIIALGFFHAF